MKTFENPNFNLPVSRLLACLLGLMATPALAQTERIAVDGGEDWQLFREFAPPEAGRLSGQEREVLVITSATGVLSTPLPKTVQELVLAETAASFAEEPDRMLIVDVAVAEAIAKGTAADEYGEYLQAPDAQGQAGGQWLGCQTDWRAATWQLDPMGSRAQRDLSIGDGNADIELKLTYRHDLHVDTRVAYSYKTTHFCLPWIARIDAAQISGRFDLTDSKLTAKLKHKVFSWKTRRELWVPFDGSMVFMVGPLPVVVGLAVPIGMGVEVKSTVATGGEIVSDVTGAYHFDYTCRLGGCERTPGGDNRNEIDFRPHDHWSLSAAVTLDPHVFAEVLAYAYHRDAASVGLGLRAGLPVTLQAGYGECPAPTDLSYLDLSAELSAYLTYRLAGNSRHLPFDLSFSAGVHLGPWKLYEFDTDELSGRSTVIGLRRNLHFSFWPPSGRDAFITAQLGGPTEPVMGYPTEYTPKMHACYSLKEAVTYEVRRASDGSVFEVEEEKDFTGKKKGPAKFTVTFDRLMQDSFTIQPLRDAAGRDFSGAPATTVAVTSQPNRRPYQVTGLVVPTHASPSQGSVTIRWDAEAVAQRYDVERRIVGRPWSVVGTPTTNRFDLGVAAGGTYELRVRACNQLGCGETSAVRTLVVAYPPSAPTLSASRTSMPATLSWTARSTATHYELRQRACGSSVRFLAYRGTNTSWGFDDPNASRGDHCFRVRACSQVGCGDESNEVRVTSVESFY